MKPVVYATAFEMGWSPGMVVPGRAVYVVEPAPVSVGVSIGYGYRRRW